MARQLDFRPLDFRQSIMSDPAGRAIAGGIRETLGAGAEALRERQAKKEAIKKDFIEQMKFDTAITGNNIINNRVAFEYGKLRDKHLKNLADRKGWLTPEDMINLRSDMQGLTNLTNELKGAQSMYDKARGMALTKDGRNTFELNSDKWGDLMSVVAGENTTDDLIGELSSIKESDTGFPYLNYRPFDLSILENAARKAYRQQHKGGTKAEVIETEKGGKKYTASRKTTTFRDDDVARQFMRSSFLGNPNATNFSKGLQKKLTDDQKQEALKMYGPQSEDPSETPYLEYYVNNVFKPEEFTKEIEETKDVVKPAAKTGRGLTLMFGGRKATGPDQYAPKKDTVEGIDFDEYVEFAKAGRTPKSVKQVTVTGAQRLINGEERGAVNLDTPDDYNVAGYSLDRNKIILTKKDRTAGIDRTLTYMVPLEGNEHFLGGLFSDVTMKEIRKRSGEAKAAPTESVELEEGFWVEDK